MNISKIKFNNIIDVINIRHILCKHSMIEVIHKFCSLIIEHNININFLFLINIYKKTMSRFFSLLNMVLKTTFILTFKYIFDTL